MQPGIPRRRVVSCGDRRLPAAQGELVSSSEKKSNSSAGGGVANHFAGGGRIIEKLHILGSAARLHTWIFQDSLCPGSVLRVSIGVDERLKGHAGYVEMVAYCCRSRTSEEYLVRRLALKSAFVIPHAGHEGERRQHCREHRPQLTQFAPPSSSGSRKPRTGDDQSVAIRHACFRRFVCATLQASPSRHSSSSNGSHVSCPHWHRRLVL